jgi:tetratricopeptide (TPR) repeat protein
MGIMSRGLPRLSPLFFLLAQSLLLPQANAQAQETKHETLSARVLRVAEDGSTVTINRGKGDNIIPGSLCIIRPNRGENYAAIEWDLYFAKGRVETLRETETVVALTDVKDTVLEGDYCDVEADIPANLAGTDIGRIAIFDIRLLDYENDEPFFELRDLIEDPSQKKIDSIFEELVEEIRGHAHVAEERAYEESIKGGLFDGMSWGEAFRKTEREHVEKYLEFVSWYPGKYINFDWTFIDVFATWMINGTQSGEPEKKKASAEPFSEEGDDLVTEGKYHEAIDSYKKALDILPDYDHAKERLALIASMLKHVKMLEEDPQDVLVRFELGREYYDLYRYENALEQFLKARELGFDPTRVDKWIGYTYSALERYGESRRIFESLHGEFPKDDNIKKWLVYVTAREAQAEEGATAESYVKTGNIKYREENYDSAISEYKKALELEPESIHIWELILRTTKRREAYKRQKWAQDYWANGEFESAKNQWETAIGLCEDIEDREGKIDIIDEIADAMYDSAFYDDAIDVYQRILDTDPQHYDSYISISNCHKEKKDYTAAVKWAERGIGVNPQEAWGYNVLGYVLLKVGKLDEAIANLRRSTELDTTYKYPNLNLGTAYVLKADYGQAQGYLRRALEIDKDYWDARDDLVDIEVVLETEESLRSNPNDTETRLRLARALYDLEDYGRAISELQKVVESEQNATAIAYLGYSHARLGKYDMGRAYLETAYSLQPKPNWKSWLLYTEAQAALKENPNDPRAYLKLGEDDLYWEDYDDALASFEQAQKLGADPDFIFRKMEAARRGKEAERYYSISSDYYDRGEYQRSLEYANRALELYREIEAKRGELWALLRSGWCYASLFKHKEALEKYEETGRRAKALGDEAMEANYLSGVGDYHRGIGDYENALKYKEAAGRLYRSSRMPSTSRALSATG